MTLPNTARFDLTDPLLRNKLGLPPQNRESTDTVPVRSAYWRKPKRSYQKRADVKKAILDVLQAADKPLSRREIFNAIGRSRSPGLLDTLAELCALGLIVQHESNYRQFVMFVYEVA